MEIELEQFTTQIKALCSAELPSCDERYQVFRTVDPYPSIPRTLLHSGHLASYAVATGMIDPFDPSKLTKPATYAVPLMGPCRYLDDDGEKHSFSLSSDRLSRWKWTDTRNKFVLRPNSICYVTLEPYFRLPAYIAGRFNLLIKNVYRGLLVGTGPLVDPGFNGYISIPIHNFTTNPYEFRAGEDFVYFEFTKLGWPKETDEPTLFHWLPRIVDDQPPFPPGKGTRRSVDDYLENVPGQGPAQNAIGQEIKRITKQNRNTRRLLGLFTVTGIAAIAALVLTSWDLLSSAQDFVDDSRIVQSDVNYRLSGQIDELRSRLAQLSAADAEGGRQLDRILSQLSEQAANAGRLDDELSDFRVELMRLRTILETGASVPARR